MTVRTDPRPINDGAFEAVLRVPPELSCSDWADTNFYLPAESSNTSGQWQTTNVQTAILNSMGNDAIEKLDLYKSARFGGTKMLVIANAYFNAHKRRNTGFYQPTKDDSDSFVKTEIEPAIRDCPPWADLLIDNREGSSQNTQSIKKFMGCTAYFKGGHAANSFRRLTLDVVLIDELDGFSADVGGEGDPTTLSWSRVKNSIFKKQIQISTPTIAGMSLIEKAARAAQDKLEYQVKCPSCGDYGPLRWGGKDSDHGFKWIGRDASTVLHHGRCCGVGWGNSELGPAIETGFWQGEKGFKTYDGIDWFFNDKPCDPPRHISFVAWSALSPFSSWEQIVQEWFDALADSKKLQAFVNTTLGQVWDQDGELAVTKELVESMLAVDDLDLLSQIRAVTAGIDVQDDRIEVQYIGHAADKSIYVLGYSVIHGDTSDAAPYRDFLREYQNWSFVVGEKTYRPTVACIDTQGHRSERTHEFLEHCRKKTPHTIIGINGVGTMWSRIADKPKTSSVSGYGSKEFFNIGVNALKRDIFELLKRFDEPERAFRFVDGIELPHDYHAQLTAERMVPKIIDTKSRMVFENPHKRRNEALDTAGYALAAKAWAQKHGNRQFKRLFNNL